MNDARDNQIIDLFLSRSESAIAQISDKYAAYCRTIAYNIVKNHQDADEILNDAYNRVWNAIPPERPDNLRAFIAKTVRNLSLNRLEREKRQKRGGGHVSAVMSELAEVEKAVSSRDTIDEAMESAAVTDALNTFLDSQTAENRLIFVSRYFGAMSVADISRNVGISAGKVKTVLFRMRKKLREHLEKEEIYL